MNKRELADFLRHRRAALQPADVGVVDNGRRRTPGLRREEVAWLAGVSTDYYERLEQARGPRPSPQVISALGRALRLSDAEHTHLAVLTGQAPSALIGPSDVVSPGVLHLLDRLGPVAAYVLNAKHDVLAWNRLAAALITDFSLVPAQERNVVRLSVRHNWCEAPPDEQEKFVQQAAADLRRTAARYPSNVEIAGLVRDLTRTSPAFAAEWHEHDVRAPQTLRKRIRHTEFGVLELDCQTLHVPGDDQRLVTYSAEPGTSDHDALERLRSYMPVYSTTTAEQCPAAPKR